MIIILIFALQITALFANKFGLKSDAETVVRDQTLSSERSDLALKPTLANDRLNSDVPKGPAPSFGNLKANELAGKESHFTNLALKSKSPRFLRLKTVTTFTDFFLITQTIFPQCVSSIRTSTKCVGRRRRRRYVDHHIVSLDGENSAGNEKDSSALHGSLNNDHESEGRKKIDARMAKYLFTVWTTTRTTVTATVKTTNTSSTISMIYVCTAGNLEFPPGFMCPG